MSFNEKLQYLRKENKLSQEQLADMLDVTRQSVSKWESGTTYPEMDKLITMCKIFKCSLDDLTNDEVTEIKVEKKNSNVINGLISNVSEIINGTVNMIKSMKSGQVIGMILSLFVLGLLLMILRIPFTLIEEGFYTVVSNIGSRQVVGFISGLFNLILDVMFFALYVLAFVYIYKVAYLDKYEFIEASLDNEEKLSKEKVEIAKEVKIVEKRPYKENTIFTFLGNIIMGFMRFLVGCFTIPFIFTLVILFALIAVSIYLFFQDIVYIGLFISIIFAIVLNIWFIESCSIFVFNKKASFKRLIWTFIVGLCGLGMGLGIFTLELSDINFINDLPEEIEKTTTSETFVMSSDLTLRDAYYYNWNIDYEVDESLTDKVIVTASFYEDNKNVVIKENGYYITFEYYYSNVIGLSEKYRTIFKDCLKNKVFYAFDKMDSVSITVTSSKKNLDTIWSNNAKYLQNSRLMDCYYQDQKIEEYESEIDEYKERIDALNERIIELEEYKNRVKDIATE